MRPYTLYPIPYTLDPKPKKGSKFEPFSPQRLYKMSRKNITRSCDVCAFPYRSTNGPLRFESRIAEPSEWPHPACTAAARCVRVLPAFSTQNLNCLHHPTVQDQHASNIRAAALRSLRSDRHSLCYGVLLFEGTPFALLDRIGLTAPNLRTRLRWVEHNIYWINKFSFRRFELRCQKGSGSFPIVGSFHLEGTPSR